MELTDSSPVIGQPKAITKTLTKFQKAMLCKCLQIESQNKSYGFLGDKPGTGKTAVILSLVASDKVISKGSQTIIVVPQNLVTQWSNEIDKFCNDDITSIIIKDYNEIMLFRRGEEYINYYKSFDIIIVPASIYTTLEETLDELSYNVKRIIFDEIDTLESMFNDKHIREIQYKQRTSNIYKQYENKSKMNVKITWYISASINNLIETNGDLEGKFTLGSLVLSLEDFKSHYVKCSNEFVEKYSLNKFKCIQENINCISVIDKWSNFLSVEQLDYINSLSFKKIKGKLLDKNTHCENQIVKLIVEDYNLLITTIKRDITENQEKITTCKKMKVNTLLLDKKLLELTNDLKFYESCIQKFFEILKVNNYQDFEKEYEKYIVKFDYTKSKLQTLKSFFKNLKKDEKVIIFSDYTDGFNEIYKLLDEMKLGYTDLAKGNIESIDKSIEEYKYGDTKILTIDSATEGCGLNFENTDCIVFIHRTNETLKEQMIGRALRPGRTGDLKVITLLNKNECV